jgi:hypothetical protein
VQVGFGQSPPIAEFKSGFWTPVYIDVTAGPEGTPRGELVVESIDSDEVPNHYTVPLPQLDSSGRETILAFTKPGSEHSKITVRAQVDDRIIATSNEDYLAMGLDKQLVLIVGSVLPGLRAALNPAAKQPEEDVALPKENPRRLALVDDIRMLPNRWFAYEAIDLLVLSTGNRDFVTALLNEREGRKEALAEWLRRGGRMILSVGRNQDMVSKLEAIQALLPVAVDGTAQLPRLRSVAKWSGSQHPPLTGAAPANNPGGAPPPVVVAKLEPKPGRETETLLEEQDGSSKTALIVRGPYGLGRVTVIALDLDQQSAFGKWSTNAQKDFWKQLLQETAPPLPAEPNNQRPGFTPPYGNPQYSDLASMLQANLEDFEDVPVISFGWVALFILLYILVVGPLDYLFLKKVVKRLELTWITFPTVVITISVAAYFTAYWLKGNDQKINKVDLIDIDLQSQQVYGNTWFTIFSPRIQHYTIGLEPTTPEWVPAALSGPANGSVVLSWMARPEVLYNRTQTQGLFRRAYEYLPDANGLVGVPIQVWSTKSFAATWQAPLHRTRPLISANLQRAKEKSSLAGKITSHLPVELDNVAIYAGSGPDAKWYAVGDSGRLVPEVPATVANIHAPGTESLSMQQWLTSVPRQSWGNANPQRPRSSPAPQPTASIIKQLLFSQLAGAGTRNSALRYLDQSWRRHHKDEVILFGRIARKEGSAEELAAAGTSPSRLWLGSLPAAGPGRPPLSGTLAQETYVRMIVPVRSVE